MIVSRPQPSPLLSLIKSFSREYSELGDILVVSIQDGLTNGLTPRQAVNKAFKKHQVTRRVRDAILESVVTATAIGAGVSVVANPNEFKRTYLNKTFSGDRLSLAQRIARQTDKNIIIDTIDSELKASTTFRKLAQSLTDKDLINGELPAHLKNVIAKSKRFTNQDPQLLNALKTSQKQIEKLALKGATSGNLKTAYNDVLKAIEKGSARAIERATAQAVRDKARYNAERIARTEIARAYGYGVDIQAENDTDVIGLKYNLSTNHPAYDICDVHTKANLYGMGKGVYPKDKQPPYPFHPHCRCVKNLVYRGEARLNKKFHETAPNRFFNEQSDENLKALFGVGGFEKWKKTKDWKNNLINWNGHQKPDLNFIKSKVIIPPKVELPKVSIKAGTIPISRAIQLPEYGLPLTQLTEALNAINKVHGDGDLPKLPVIANKGDDYGIYARRLSQNFLNNDIPIDIRIKRSGNHKGLTLIHEIGHFLDNQSMGVKKGFASQQLPLFDDFLKVARESKPIKQIQQIANDGFISVDLPNGTKRRHYLKRGQLDEFLTPYEIWARSYAQYIAEKSKNKVLLQDVEVARNLEAPFFHRQWTKKEFEPILIEIDKMFKTLGWID